MKLSVITITCRKAPRFGQMSAALAANLAKHKDVFLEWIVVDERLWYDADVREEMFAEVVVEQENKDRDGTWERLNLKHVAPKPSKWRGPDVEVDRPDHNSARNTGLAYATGDYIAFVDDCTVVGGCWLETLLLCAALDGGYRCNVAPTREAVFRMPRTGLVHDREVADRLVEAAPTTIAGCAFGAPRAAFDAIGGFDESYGGESGCEDTDAFVRLSHTGLLFYSSRAGWAYHIAGPRAHDDVCSLSEVFHAQANNRRYNALLGDRGRTGPAAAQPSLAELRACVHGVDGAQGREWPEVSSSPPRANGPSLVEEIPSVGDDVASPAPTGDAAPALSGDSDLELERDPTGDPPREDGPVAA